MTIKKREKKKRVAVYLSPQLYRKFRLAAVKRGHPMQWYLLGCVNEIVKGERGKGRRRKVRATRKSQGEL